jgi:hypothetical protein
MQKKYLEGIGLEFQLQCSWDAAFIAIGNSYFNTDRAIKEFEFLFHAQCQNGMVPHIVFKFVMIIKLDMNTRSGFHKCPLEKLNIADWLFNLPDAEYQRLLNKLSGREKIDTSIERVILFCPCLRP